MPLAAQSGPVLSEDRHWWFHTRTASLLALLDQYAPPAGLVLDVGGGAGNMVHHLSRYGRVVGIDNARKPLRVARGRGYLALLAEATAAPFPDATFSLVALLDVIEHCPDDHAVLAEAYRVCSAGGLAVVTTPALSWLWSHNDVDNRHLRRYSRQNLASLLAEVGFDVLRVTYSFFLVFPAAAGLVLLRKLLGASPSLATPDEDSAYQVEMEEAPGALNSLLLRAGSLEARLARRHDLPVGTGLLAVARKPC